MGESEDSGRGKKGARGCPSVHLQYEKHYVELLDWLLWPHSEVHVVLQYRASVDVQTIDDHQEEGQHEIYGEENLRAIILDTTPVHAMLLKEVNISKLHIFNHHNAVLYNI